MSPFSLFPSPSFSFFHYLLFFFFPVFFFLSLPFLLFISQRNPSFFDLSVRSTCLEEFFNCSSSPPLRARIVGQLPYHVFFAHRFDVSIPSYAVRMAATRPCSSSMGATLRNDTIDRARLRMGDKLLRSCPCHVRSSCVAHLSFTALCALRFPISWRAAPSTACEYSAVRYCAAPLSRCARCECSLR